MRTADVDFYRTHSIQLLLEVHKVRLGSKWQISSQLAAISI